MLSCVFLSFFVYFMPVVIIFKKNSRTGRFRLLLGLLFRVRACPVAVWVPVGLVFLLFIAWLSGLLECIHNLLFTFLSLRFIYSFNIFICRYICLTVYFIVHVYYIICYIVLSQLCFIF